MAPAVDRFDLSERQAIVTGASRGIGFAIAQGLAERGASVVITGRKAETLTAAADQLRAGGANVQPIVCHQGDPTAIVSLFEQLDRLGTSPEIVVINAATNPVMGPLLQTDLAAWQKILEVNLTGSLVMAQQAARRMLPRKKGSLIFMASIAGLDPMPAIPAYSVSKAGVIGLTKALAKELGPAGIRVNAIAPGWWRRVRRSPFPGSAAVRTCHGGRASRAPRTAGRCGRRRHLLGIQCVGLRRGTGARGGRRCAHVS